MIISASYRTDIPAFYGDWFMNRLGAGNVKVRNPYNFQLFDVSLRKQDVDGFVFWTKNVGPFLPHLDELTKRGFPWFVTYTITGLPRTIEKAVVDQRRAIEHVREISARYGKRRVVWRYDPIVMSDQTTSDWHVEKFTEIAWALAGEIDECNVSFTSWYKKTAANMAAAATAGGFTWADPPEGEKRALVAKLAQIANDLDMQLAVCSQPNLVAGTAVPAVCVDARRLRDCGAGGLKVKTKGNRPGCACHESRDIGAYDTCPHGCSYCYAVKWQQTARENYRQHDPLCDHLG